MRTACPKAVRRFLGVPSRTTPGICAAPGCRRESVVIYLGVELCEMHRDKVYSDQNWPKVSVEVQAA